MTDPDSPKGPRARGSVLAGEIAELDREGRKAQAEGDKPRAAGFSRRAAELRSQLELEAEQQAIDRYLNGLGEEGLMELLPA